MRGARRIQTALVLGMGASLFLKMVLLEPVVLPLGGMEVILAAALLPLALLLRSSGVVLIAWACGTAHFLHDGAAREALVAALSVGVATAVAYTLVAKDGRTWRWLAAGWTLTAVLALGMATGSTLLLGQAFAPAFAGVLARVWVAVNGVGVPFALLVLRLGRSYLPGPTALLHRT